MKGVRACVLHAAQVKVHTRENHADDAEKHLPHPTAYNHLQPIHKICYNHVFVCFSLVDFYKIFAHSPNGSSCLFSVLPSWCCRPVHSFFFPSRLLLVSSSSPPPPPCFNFDPPQPKLGFWLSTTVVDCSQNAIGTRLN